MVMITITGLAQPLARFRAEKFEGAAQTSDEALVRAVADGDRRAMQTLYQRHNVRVYRFLLRLIHDESKAEDLVSEVFLDVWRQADRFKGQAQVSTWLMSIARHKAISIMRMRSDDQLDERAASMIEDPADDPEAVVGNADRGALVQACLSQLSAPHREVIDLVYYHDKSVDEVARIIGIPASTVKTRMFYARKQMGKLFAAAGVGEL
jgi:RNA polymerase sigma-70 factor (ECF subfamily)